MIDSSGRGELSHELESDNVLKSGLNIGDFNVAAVVSGTSVPLSGYSGRDKLEWKNRYDLVNRHKAEEVYRIDKEKIIEEIVSEIPEAPITEYPVEEPVQIIAPKPAPEPEVIEKVPEEAVQIVEEKIQVEVQAEAPIEMPPVMEVISEPEQEIIMQQPVIESAMPKCPPIVPMEEPCDIEKEKTEYEDIHQYYCDDDSEEEHYDDYNKYIVSPYYSGDMYVKLKKILRRLIKCEPFEKERGCTWYKVGDAIFEINRVAVPYMGYMMPMGYPFMSEGCSMMIGRKDCILGTKYDDKEEYNDDGNLIRYLFFGVPAIYSKRNEQYYKSRGFMKFKPHRSKGYGYFIMCLDLGSGMICQMD